MLQDVRILDASAVSEMTRDAKVVAIRWDLIKWSLVLDMDVPASEARASPVRRAWLVLGGVSEISLDLESARLPDGVWLSGPAAVGIWRMDLAFSGRRQLHQRLGKGRPLRGTRRAC